MKVQLIAAVITFLATLTTGCISQQDKGTIRQWQELHDHIWEETAPAESPAPVEAQQSQESQESTPAS